MEIPKTLKHIHFLGIGGVATGNLACALAGRGIRITGSDKAVYEPMRSVLEKAGIEVLSFHPAHAQNLTPDVVLIGNVISRTNPEVQAWLQGRTPFLSFPEALRLWIIGDKNSILCAGTHGKTTTTSWVSFLLKQSGLRPSYFIGGVPFDLPTSCVEEEDSTYFVGEADEYDSSFFDKGPKFLHYNPRYVILSAVELDHTDIYRDIEHVESAFEKLLALIPGNGHCLVRHEDARALRISKLSLGPVETFGVSPHATWQIADIKEARNGFHFSVLYRGRPFLQTQSPLLGMHNLCNLLSGIALGHVLGLSTSTLASLVPQFRGVVRRQQILLDKGIVLIDDFAHHPTEVAATLAAVRGRFGSGHRLWALFEPRSATARTNTHQDLYPDAFAAADVICLKEPSVPTHVAGSAPVRSGFSTEKLAHDLQKQTKEAHVFRDTSALIEHVLSNAKNSDVIVVMSNGDFDKIQVSLLEKLPHCST